MARHENKRKENFERLSNIVEQMVDHLHDEAGVNALQGSSMLNLPDVLDVQELCFQILFPGYFCDSEPDHQTIRFLLGEKLTRLQRKLSEQIRRCFCYRCNDGCQTSCANDAADCVDRAERISWEFCDALPYLREMLNLDIQAAFDGDPAAKSLDEIVYCYPGFRAVMVNRIAHVFFELEVPLLPRILSEHAHSLTGVDIHPGATIGKSFFIDHGTGVVIGETTVIGDNVKIYQGVTLGALSFPKDERGRVIKGLKRHPTLEDNVTVYANATILGGDTVIGRGVTVGGNTFVTKSINADSLVLSKPPELDLRSKKK